MIYYVSGQKGNFQEFTNTTVEKIADYCKSKKVLGVDTETEGLFNHQNKTIMFQIGDKENQFVIDTRTVDISPLKEVLEDNTICKIFWNAKFDLAFIKYFYNIDTNNIYDGFLAEALLTNGHEDRTLSLGGICERDLGVILDKDIRNKFIGLEGRPFTEKQIDYGARDVEYLIDIKEIQDTKLTEKDLHDCLRLENKFVKVLVDIELGGFYLDSALWTGLENSNKEKYYTAKKILDSYVINNGHTEFIRAQLDLFETENKCDINWDSPQQVVLFAKKLGIDTTVVDRKTGDTKESVEERQIKKSKHEFVKLYLNYKKLKKSLSTYGIEFLKNINPITGRVHSNYWQILDTGRISSSKPNLQNIPAGIHRECFIPEKGNKLIVCDYSQQEPRITADVSGDPDLIDFYLTGDGDTHSMVASKMFSIIEGTEVIIKKGDPKRQIGKILNLKLDYGGSAYTVKDDLKVSEEEAQEFIDALAEAFPVKQEYFKKKIKETFTNGYILIDNVTKRKYFIEFFEEYLELKKLIERKGFWEDYKINKDFYRDKVRKYYTYKGKIERMSKNFPIQGCAGSMTKLAAIFFKEEITKRKWYEEVKIVNLVHDEIVVESLKRLAEEASTVLSECMERAGKYFCKKVPMIAEAVVVNYWEH